MHPFLVPVMTFFAGFIDAIAGGGGIITIPMWTMVVGPGAAAVGTNKVGALMAASTALIVYSRHHPIPWRKGFIFLLSITAGSWLGSQATSLIPPRFFAGLIFIICPVVLWMVWSREKLFGERPDIPAAPAQFILAGFLVGLYDGFFGPGGGTFMLLALLGMTHLPLMQALALSKLANALSAFVSLSSFAWQGVVNWQWGLIGGCSIMLGAFLGARYTSKRSVHAVRPALTVVVIMLMAKIGWDFISG